jgi:hypothetical protein
MRFVITYTDARNYSSTTITVGWVEYSYVRFVLWFTNCTAVVTKENDMNEIKVFQTGRQYTDKGQRIAYTLDKDNIYFVDVDRGIDGVFPNTFNDESINSSWLLYMYDTGNYRYYEYKEILIRDALKTKAMLF